MPKRTKTELLAEAGQLPEVTLAGTRCIANNKRGGKCKRWAIRGGSVCAAHGGAAPQVREAARQRLEGSIDRLLAALVQIALDDTQPAAARVAAIKDGLDRAGFGTRDNKLTVEVRPFEVDLEGLLADVATPDYEPGIVRGMVVHKTDDESEASDPRALPPVPNLPRDRRTRDDNSGPRPPDYKQRGWER